MFVLIHTDVDECLAGVHDCHPNADCVNTPDSVHSSASVRKDFWEMGETALVS